MHQKYVRLSLLLLLLALIPLTSCQPQRYDLKFNATITGTAGEPGANCSGETSQKLGFTIIQKRTKIEGSGSGFTLRGGFTGKEAAFDLLLPVSPCPDYWKVRGTIQQDYTIKGTISGGDCHSGYAAPRLPRPDTDEFFVGCTFWGTFTAQIVNAPKEVYEQFDKALNP